MVPDFQSLSPQQMRAYLYLKEVFAETGSLPSLRELCRAMGWKAVGTAQDVIRALIDKSFLKREGRRLFFVEQLSFRRIPILGSAPAGPPVEAVESHEGELLIPSHLRGPHFALSIRGDSMEEAGIQNGDLVIVRQENEARSQEVIVALDWGEVTVKRLVRKGRQLWLKPENSRYSAWKISDPDFRVLGKVVGLHRYDLKFKP